MKEGKTVSSHQDMSPFKLWESSACSAAAFGEDQSEMQRDKEREG